MSNSLLAKISRSISNLVPSEASRFIVALSGGPDSVALLSLSLAWSRGSKDRPVVEALHIHHGLRDKEADRDALHCAKICAHLGVPLHLVVDDAAKKSKAESLSLETAGREIRRARFVELGKARSAPIVLTGHHGDDQAETVLGNLLRGCGLRGLRGMEPLSEIESSGILIGRPLLKIRQQEILNYLEENGLAAIVDSTNRSPVHRRNRLRLETIPALEKENPEIIMGLLNISEEASRRWEILQHRINRCLERVYIRRPRISLPPDCCDGLEGPEIGDFLRKAILHASGEEGGLIREHLNSLEKLVTGESRSASLLLPGNRKAIRCGGWIHIGPDETHPDGLLQPFQITQEIPMVAHGLQWKSTLPEPLTIRPLESGEKIPGRTGSIEELLRIRGVPPDLRHKWPLAISADGQIRWFAGFSDKTQPIVDSVTISATDPTQLDRLSYHLLRITAPA